MTVDHLGHGGQRLLQRHGILMRRRASPSCTASPTLLWAVRSSTSWTSASHIPLNQIAQSFIRTQDGRTRSRLIMPKPFFVHSDLPTMIQVTDIVADVPGRRVRLTGMTKPRKTGT
ncbi:MAG: hypothetical protein H6842_06225 [Rhodospirillaceae bacterium]|nr:hypothetical protein [Rhodospirillaceae bacterium]